MTSQEKHTHENKMFSLSSNSMFFLCVAVTLFLVIETLGNLMQTMGPSPHEIFVCRYVSINLCALYQEA